MHSGTLGPTGGRHEEVPHLEVPHGLSVQHGRMCGRARRKTLLQGTLFHQRYVLGQRVSSIHGDA